MQKKKVYKPLILKNKKCFTIFSSQNGGFINKKLKW
jgi:hypothetical protein